MFSRLIGSTSSPFRNARLRALYRKQYLTPTIILREIVSDLWGRIDSLDGCLPQVREYDAEPQCYEEEQRGTGRPTR
jgi:hypothetical protein